MWETLKFNVVFGYEILMEAGRSYGRDRVNRMAAAVAYRMMFALAPVMLIAVWVFGLIVGDSATAEAEIFDRIANIAGDEIADAIDVFVSTAVTGGDTAAIVGFVLLLWTASSLFLEVQNGLNDVFGVPYEYTTGVVATIIKRGLGFLWSLGLGVLVIAVWALQLVWGFFENFFDDIGWFVFHDVVNGLSPFVTLLVLPFLFALIFQTMTRVRVRLRALLLGTAFTSVVFVLAGLGVRFYFSWDAETSASRVAGALFVILLATYFLSSVFLYGAEVTKVYDNYLEHGSLQPSLATARDTSTTSAVVETPEPSMPMTTVAAFFGGLFVGWRRKR